MKDLKLSFPYPSTSRHNLSQDIGTSMSLGLVTPIRVIEVLGGDSHRIGTSFSLISNPLVKPLLQGVKMRYCRFWVPRRIYHLDQRANNSNYDIMNATVRHGYMNGLQYNLVTDQSGSSFKRSANFCQSSIFDYLGYASIESNMIYYSQRAGLPKDGTIIPDNAATYPVFQFNVEPYLGYLDIVRNYFADSATGLVAWSWVSAHDYDTETQYSSVYISPLVDLDAYIDNIQNTNNIIRPFDISQHYASNTVYLFNTFCLPTRGAYLASKPLQVGSSFGAQFRLPRLGLAVPLLRPDRLSRWFDTRPLTSQNATVSPTEISIANLSFLAKIQRYLTRRFFGGSRFTDIMYSVLGQKVPHVDSPVLLDVFDTEIGTEMVASTNATESSNPGVLGGFFASKGRLTTGRGSYRRRYSFNEPGYLIDVAYIMPRLFRAAFVPDYYFISSSATDVRDSAMSQGNFIPDFNGIGWQQPVQVSGFLGVGTSTVNSVNGFAAEPSWQQYRTLPDICTAGLNPLRSTTLPGGPVNDSVNINSPLFVFTDRMYASNGWYGFTTPEGVVDSQNMSRMLLSLHTYADFNFLNSVFGSDTLTLDNIYIVFRYAHHAKRQVTKRFTLNF